ncbi:nucleotidyltransferase domain-containing protein [Streptomyces sp. PT12]|uniref:nucleotidyltransferase domain-containing protein n=1 Tax=Streptomyces sp. PT12 TaxID=1510197 RepID=UPI00285254DD|nr:nucleotidyltransferase domain-containing protein [Streptomyces sp. PT12]
MTTASSPATPSPPPASLDAFLAHATAQPTLAGLVLFGSRVYDGMPTAHSDHDLIVVVRDSAPSPLTTPHGFRSRHLDLVVMTLDEFRGTGSAEHPDAWARYSSVRARVLLDRLGGEIAAILERKRTLGLEEARAAVDRSLDAYVNQLYRSLKNERDGPPTRRTWTRRRACRSPSRRCSRRVGGSRPTPRTCAGSSNTTRCANPPGTPTASCPRCAASRRTATLRRNVHCSR